jgi:hypothetical protein
VQRKYRCKEIGAKKLVDSYLHFIVSCFSEYISKLFHNVEFFLLELTVAWKRLEEYLSTVLHHATQRTVV